VINELMNKYSHIFLEWCSWVLCSPEMCCCVSG